MGMALSLQDIMNNVSSAIERGAVPMPRAQGAMSELQAFMELDPLLASLHKQYVDARAVRLMAVKDFGAGDAMTEIALLAEDSAWCAMQTRYMELRADRMMMRDAQAMMRESEAEEILARAAEEDRKALEKFYWMNAMARAQEREKKKTDGALWLLAVWILFMGDPPLLRGYQPSFQFNRMAA